MKIEQAVIWAKLLSWKKYGQYGVYLSRTRKGTMQSKMVIEKINDMKMKLGNKMTLRKAGKLNVDSELSAKAVN